ncbi:helicase [Streptomyces badius]
MTFHQKVEEARAFAEKLPETAAELYVKDASDDDLAAADKLPKSSIDAAFYELKAGRHVPPDRVWSAWLCGDHLVAERREALRQFANGIDAAGRRVHRAFLASVRVLGEGVNITGERGVEAVCFADTRGSQVEIVQNIGRALRLNKDGSTKVARIIVPVFLEPNEEPPTWSPAPASSRSWPYSKGCAATMSAWSSSWPLARSRAGSARSTSGGTKTARSSGPAAKVTARTRSTTTTPRPPPKPRSSTSPPRATPPRSRPSCAPGCTGRSRWCGWRATRPCCGGGRRTRSPGSTPFRTTSRSRWGSRRTSRLAAGCISSARRCGPGELEERRKVLLDAPEAGMVWEPGEEAWENKLAALRSYRRATGRLAPRQDAVWGEGEAMVPIGQHMANLRRKGGLGKDPKRAAERAAQLAAIDEDWNCPWPLNWQRHYRILADLVDADGTSPTSPPASHTTATTSAPGAGNSRTRASPGAGFSCRTARTPGRTGHSRH